MNGENKDQPPRSNQEEEKLNAFNQQYLPIQNSSKYAALTPKEVHDKTEEALRKKKAAEAKADKESNEESGYDSDTATYKDGKMYSRGSTATPIISDLNKAAYQSQRATTEAVIGIAEGLVEAFNPFNNLHPLERIQNVGKAAIMSAIAAAAFFLSPDYAMFVTLISELFTVISYRYGTEGEQLWLDIAAQHGVKFEASAEEQTALRRKLENSTEVANALAQKHKILPQLSYLLEKNREQFLAKRTGHNSNSIAKDALQNTKSRLEQFDKWMVDDKTKEIRGDWEVYIHTQLTTEEMQELFTDQIGMDRTKELLKDVDLNLLNAMPDCTEIKQEIAEIKNCTNENEFQAKMHALANKELSDGTNILSAILALYDAGGKIDNQERYDRITIEDAMRNKARDVIVEKYNDPNSKVAIQQMYANDLLTSINMTGPRNYIGNNDRENKQYMYNLGKIKEKNQIISEIDTDLQKLRDTKTKAMQNPTEYGKAEIDMIDIDINNKKEEREEHLNAIEDIKRDIFTNQGLTVSTEKDITIYYRNTDTLMHENQHATESAINFNPDKKTLENITKFREELAKKVTEHRETFFTKPFINNVKSFDESKKIDFATISTMGQIPNELPHNIRNEIKNRTEAQNGKPNAKTGQEEGGIKQLEKEIKDLEVKKQTNKITDTIAAKKNEIKNLHDKINKINKTLRSSPEYEKYKISEIMHNMMSNREYVIGRTQDGSKINNQYVAIKDPFERMLNIINGNYLPYLLEENHVNSSCIQKYFGKFQDYKLHKKVPGNELIAEAERINDKINTYTQMWYPEHKWDKEYTARLREEMRGEKSGFLGLFDDKKDEKLKGELRKNFQKIDNDMLNKLIKLNGTPHTTNVGNDDNSGRGRAKCCGGAHEGKNSIPIPNSNLPKYHNHDHKNHSNCEHTNQRQNSEERTSNPANIKKIHHRNQGCGASI